MARPVLLQGGLGLEGKVLDVNHRPSIGPPRRQQIGDPLFRLRIVPGAISRIVESLLHVNEEQGRAG